MPRKKPFSSKQKKKQLQDRRRRKQGAVEDEAEAENSDNTSEGGEEEGNKVPVAKINQQPGQHLPQGKYDPNRYRLHFFQESKEELAQRKEKARQPYTKLPEESLEMTVSESVDALIDFPKRPPWDYNLSKQKLEVNEERCFKAYIEDLFSNHTPEELSYFEMNLETWRQLWRVLEMSDIFLHITDIRHPILHFSPALYKYITEDLQKHMILVLNKVDLAPPSLVIAWQQFFKQRYPALHTVCFTSFPKSEAELEVATNKLGKVVFKKRKRGTYKAMGPQELYRICQHVVNNEVDLSSWAKKLDQDQDPGYHGDEESSEESDGEAEVDRQHNTDCSFHRHERYKDGLLTIGCIGYPNVGKSSVMNGLMGKKIVSVSRTPGHTKHFQTIFLTPTVRLCDSPGLVFPCKVDKHLQILGGIYPIAQVREPYSTVGYLAQRMDLPKLLQLKPVDEDIPLDEVEWTAMDICDAWAEKRGFITAKAARLDTYRAANNLLRLAVEGRICLCLPPPGYLNNREKLEADSSTKEFIKLQSSYRLGNTASVLSVSESEESESGEESDENSASRTDNVTVIKPTKTKISNPFELLADCN